MGVPLHKLSLAEYLDWDEAQDDRNEFYKGETFARVGGTRGHHRVIVNLTRRLDAHLDGTPCQVFAESMKLQIGDDGCFYPDVMVSSGGTFTAADRVITAPVLIIEVLSPSTRGYDQRNKFLLYRQLDSLREYVLIDPVTRVVETFSAIDGGAWLFTDQTRADVLDLVSIGLKLPMEWVFKGIESEGA